MKKKPNIYKGQSTPISHNKEFCTVKNMHIIQDEIDSCLSGLGPISEKKVRIRTGEGEKVTYIVKRYDGKLKTIMNDIIYEKDIISIEKV